MDFLSKSYDNHIDNYSIRNSVKSKEDGSFITIKIKRSDNKTTKVRVNPNQETVLNLKSKVFQKE